MIYLKSVKRYFDLMYVSSEKNETFDNKKSGFSQSKSWVIEDDLDAAKAIRLMLEKEGSNTTHFSCGAELLDALHSKKTSPDVICLDLSLPDFSGLELLSYIKKKEPLIPVVIITSNTSKESILKAVELGAYDYLPKSPDHTKFTTTFKRALEYKRLQVRLSEIPEHANQIEEELSLNSVGSLREKENQAIRKALRETSGHIEKAAKILEISRATLYRKMKKYGISTRGQF